MKARWHLLWVLASLLAVSETKGQPNNINHWLQYSGSYWINPQWAVSTHLQYRTYRPVTDLRTAFAGADVQYKFKEAPAMLTVGYAHLTNRHYITAEETDYTQENRLYQLLTLRGQVGNVSVSHRYQVEERWLTQGYHTRFRYMVGLRIPLAADPEGKTPWYGILRNEVRVIIRDQPFDSNRVFGGIGYVFNKNLTLEGTWMSQLVGSGKHQHFTMLVLRHEFGHTE